jgi:hypothetical protein
MCSKFDSGTHFCPRQLIDIIETVYRGASKGRGLVVSPKGQSFIAYLFDSPTSLVFFDRLLYALQVLDVLRWPLSCVIDSHRPCVITNVCTTVN